MTTHPRIDLTQFSRGQLKKLGDDVSGELERREAEDRRALEARLRGLVEEAGFDPGELRLARPARRKGRKSQSTNGESDD